MFFPAMDGLKLDMDEWMWVGFWQSLLKTRAQQNAKGSKKSEFKAEVSISGLLSIYSTSYFPVFLSFILRDESP